MNETQVPHYHLMESDYGDPLDRPISTWKQAVRLLAKEKANLNDTSCWHIEGSAQDGAYYFYEKRSFTPDPDRTDFDMMLSIYPCTGEQACPCEEK